MQEKYIRKLMQCKSLDEFLSMFFGLPMSEKLSAVNGELIIPKDTILYRVRRFEGRDLVLESDWTMPPKECVKTAGRFNHKGHSVLYVGTMDFILPREIGLLPGDVYYLAKYRCSHEIKVGSFLKGFDLVNSILHKVAMAVENDNKLTASELHELVTVSADYKQITDIACDILAPLYIHKLMRRELYDVTNKLSDLILHLHPNGLRYCSAYEPLEFSGANEIITLDGELKANFVLTENGVKCLEWLGSEKKQYTLEEYQKDLKVMIKEMNSSNCDLSE